MSTPRARRHALGMSAALTGMGILHFVRPEPFDGIVPRAMPGSPRTWTHLSGVAELVTAGLLAVPRTRRLGGLAAEVLFVAVYPANLQMAWDARHASGKRRAIAFGRLPFQLPMIAQADLVRREG